MQKILFVCRGNIGRSQVAAAIYNTTHQYKAMSAGTFVDPIGQKLKDGPGAANAIAIMKEKGIDIGENITRQLTEKMLDDFDRVIVMAEPENTPLYLKNSPKFEYWPVLDMKGQDLHTTRKLRDQIESLIQKHF